MVNVLHSLLRNTFIDSSFLLVIVNGTPQLDEYLFNPKLINNNNNDNDTAFNSTALNSNSTSTNITTDTTPELIKIIENIKYNKNFTTSLNDLKVLNDNQKRFTAFDVNPSLYKINKVIEEASKNLTIIEASDNDEMNTSVIVYEIQSTNRKLQQHVLPIVKVADRYTNDKGLKSHLLNLNNSIGDFENELVTSLPAVSNFNYSLLEIQI